MVLCAGSEAQITSILLQEACSVNPAKLYGQFALAGNSAWFIFVAIFRLDSVGRN
jgi:hypothetical protein